MIDHCVEFTTNRFSFAVPNDSGEILSMADTGVLQIVRRIIDYSLI